MSLIPSIIDPSKSMDKNAVSSRRIPVDDYPIFTKEDPLEILESYIVDYLATCVTLVAFSFDKLLKIAHDIYYLERKRKSNKMGDGPSGTVNSPVKMAKTSRALKMSLGTIPEAEGTCFRSVKQAKVPPAQKQPSDKSPMIETSLIFL